MRNYRYNICVIGAEVNNIEQRQILEGIIAEAQARDAVIMVLSNLYNHLDPARIYSTDNKIYELISDIRTDAFIMLSESFVNAAVRKRIHELLKKRTDVPVILAGTELPEFEPELFPCINTSDENDMEAVTDRLIEEKGFTDISLLTGPLSLAPSEKRLNGYRRSLEKHGIAYDESLVHEGNFWYDSGEKLAERYINGELPYPQALICSNDYMAFGVLDAFAAADIDITGHMTVVGYEYIPERSLHKPLLTTYQRNRYSLGRSAVDLLVNRLNGKTVTFMPPSGTLISGQTCPFTSLTVSKLQEELLFLRTQKQYAVWNLKSDMESKLTESKNYDEFISAMGDELFIVRYAKDIVLCLFENWARVTENPGNTLVCRNVNSYARRDDIVLDVCELNKLTEHFPDMAVFYFNPVIFKKRLLGYCSVMYDAPDTYDDTYRHWLKSVSNGLEFLRLKTDINFLLQCSTLSPSYDGVTGLFSTEGMRSAFQLMKNTDRQVDITAVRIRILENKDVFSSEAALKDMTARVVSAAKTIKRFCGKYGFAGRISEFELLLIYPSGKLDIELLADAVFYEIMFSEEYAKSRNTDTLLYCTGKYSGNYLTFSQISEKTAEKIEETQREWDSHRSAAYFRELEKIHNEIFWFSSREYSLDEISASLNLHPNYFNRIYRRIYSTSFYHDQIYSRVRFARHLLMTTDDPIAKVAEKCGYIDNKYFMRQFAAMTGLSPKQYRMTIKEFFG